AVPAGQARYGLSQIVNALLELDPPRPFEFLVNGKLLRSSLLEHVGAHNLSAEVVLQIEYTFAVLPPRPGPSLPHEDWVSSLAAVPAQFNGPRRSEMLLSLSYDCSATLWAPATATEGGAKPSSLALEPSRTWTRCAPRPQRCGAFAGRWALTGGEDGLVRAWDWGSQDEASTSACAAELRGHTDAVVSVATHAAAAAATGGWDTSVCLWKLRALEEAEKAAEEEKSEGSEETKRRRTGEDGSATASSSPSQLSPAVALKSHTGAVSALAWADANSLVSGSWDKSVRVWDCEVQRPVDSFRAPMAVYAVALPPPPSADSPVRPLLVALSGADRSLRIWDARVAGSATPARVLRGHSDWTPGLAWHPTSAHHLLSASHDGSARLWDLRAEGALFSIPAPQAIRCWTAAWVGERGVAFGGASRDVSVCAVVL
ncbi:hypothetical protein H632_c764p0, partial [Helicosporidium sp. ATCC 50920]